MKKYIFKILDITTNTIFICLIAVALLQVLARYVFKMSFPWTEELARVLLVWTVYLGIAEVESGRTNISTTLLIEKLPEWLYRILRIIAHCAGIGLMICLFWGSISQIKNNSIYYLSSMPFISRTIFYVPVLIGAPLSIWMLFDQIMDVITNNPPEVSDEGGNKL